MTFVAQETSTEGGQPTELFEFVLGAETFFFTSSEDEQVFDANTYTPAAISRTQINIGPEERSEVITITMPAIEPFPRRYIGIVPGTKASLTVKRVHRTDAGDELAVFFKGIVRSVGFSQDGVTANIAVLPLSRAMSKTVPRFLYNGICNHVLYDPRCGVNKESFRFTGVVSAIVGSVYTIPGVGASVATPATSGFVRVGNTDWRLVLSQSTDDLTLLLPFNISDVVVGTTVDVFAGCAHTIVVCHDQFDIVINYGGFTFVPLKNPFETGLD